MIIRSENVSHDDVINRILNHSKMSFKSKGLLLWILSQADDFILTGKSVARHNKIYPVQLYSAFDELESLGYIKSDVNNPNADCWETSYTVYEEPVTIVSIQHKKRVARERALSESTNNFIKKYLKPNRHFKKKDSISSLYDQMINPKLPDGTPIVIDWNQVCDYILDNLTYEEFLHTMYWEIISYYVKIKRGFTCNRCSETYHIMSKLNVHHNTYIHHGEEHKPEVIDEDLELLCYKCHIKHHGELNRLNAVIDAGLEIDQETGEVLNL